MAKRISRRELIEKIRWIEAEERILRHDNESLIEKLNDLNKRFIELGSKAETYDANGCIECIEIKPQAWGHYAHLIGNDFSEEFIEELKYRLADGIVRGLLNSNYVQIIVKEDPIHTDMKTLAAKLYVVPWDKLVRTVRIHA